MRYFYKILGLLLLFPIQISDVFGIDIDTFRKEVYKPDNIPAGTALKNAPAEAKLNIILDFAINLILYASGSVAVFFLVLGGIRYIIGFSRDESLDGAKKTIQYALLGLAVVILSYAIVTNIIDLIFKSTV